MTVPYEYLPGHAARFPSGGATQFFGQLGNKWRLKWFYHAERTAMTRQAVPSSDHSVSLSNELVEQHLDAVFAYAYRLTARVDRAEDLTQHTFLAAFQHRDQLRDVERLRPWLMSIARNAFYNQQRERVPTPASQLEGEVLEVGRLDERDWLGDEELVQSALMQLSAEHRLIVLMYYFEDLSYREIASELSLPVGTVMSRLSRAKQQLRRYLATPEVARS